MRKLARVTEAEVISEFLKGEFYHREFDPARPGNLAAKIHNLRTLMRSEGPRSTILLIGIDETRPATLLEGNHRFVASLLLPREIMLRRLRVVCGFSPSMETCCWYKTTVSNLARYVKNRIIHLLGRDTDFRRLTPAAPRSRAVEASDAAAVPTAKTE
jgi:hypothetical protein